jgi:cobalt-zinc-cadmium efflux system protein
VNDKHIHKPKLKKPSAEHGHYREIEKKKLRLTMAITGIVMLIEIAGGILTNSLALLSDAGHMFTHFVALGISFGAIIIASKEPCHHRTYGYYRAEILAALFNSVFLFAVTAYIFYAAIKRIIYPESVLGLQMLLVAAVGLAVNAASIFILKGSVREDINIRGAFLHMLSDTISSVVIIFGGLILYFTGWYIIDPILAIGICFVILVWVWKLFRDSVNILLEAAPRGMNIDDITDELKRQIPEIRDVTDMHIWVITSNMYSLTAHVVVDNLNLQQSREIIARINKLLDEKYDIEHTTIQFDSS